MHSGKICMPPSFSYCGQLCLLVFVENPDDSQDIRGDQANVRFLQIYQGDRQRVALFQVNVDNQGEAADARLRRCGTTYSNE